LRAKVREYEFEVVSKEINELIALFDEQNNEKIVRKLKHLIPEYISSNSEYERLDTK